jgi:Restriction endonuclease
MSNYDFRQLSPHDFEQLARDLLQARDGIVLESFKNGRDLGIDFRHASSKGNIIVQCKHYVGTGLPGLIRDLRNEAVKIEKIKLTRYILVTSVGLTPLNKIEIQSLFGSVLVTADILGPDDINNLLGLHPEVERRHYKLWLASRVVLDRVIHNASITQSEFDVEASIAIYGATSAAQHIRERLTCSIQAMWRSSRALPVSVRLRSRRCCSTFI